MADKHRRIAARIRRDPGVIAESKSRLVRLIAREPPPPDPVLQESLDLFLPDGWEQRLVPFGPAAPHLRCLEIHDLVLSKLAAGRLKDYELIAVLLDRKLAELAAVRDRIAAVPDLHMRAVLAARLQIVLEGAAR